MDVVLVGPVSSPFEELLGLVRRELGANDVFVVEEEAAHPETEGETPAAEETEADEKVAFEVTLKHPLPDGRVLAAGYASAPPDAAALEKRLAMLVESFRDTLSDRPGSSSRPPVTHILRDELAAVAERSGARDALVIDAHSPVVWGSARTDEAYERGAEVIDLFRGGAAGEPGSSRRPARKRSDSLIERAIALVRRLPAMDTLPKGGHLSEVVSKGEFGYLARSFAGIYVLVLVFDAPIEELRAKRAVSRSLTAIERLVLAIPPQDPPPAIGGGMVVRRRRR